MGKLDGKVAIVTGASRGIGKAIAKLFAGEGAKVVCTARTMREGEHQLEGSLETTVSEITSQGAQALAVPCDVSSEQDCERLVATTREHYGPCDVLVNNAVLSYPIPVRDLTIKRWIRSFAVNVHGPFMLSKMVLEDMLSKRSGAIVNISSGAAVGPGRGPYRHRSPFGLPWTCYGAAKAALERFTQGLADEVYQNGISVTCISPSDVVATPGTVFHKLVGGDKPQGEPADYMAQAVLILATEPLDRVTGRVCYSQQILKEYAVIADPHAMGVDYSGSGFSRMRTFPHLWSD
ncbi:MAG: SDR family NAD(P)-dependent oxidoreductase [Candidatus Binataceae bacterium]|jgi:NAD(P)-dependent dehydrogenase (short-subunit alcohol dehydrogenase family)